MIKHSILIPSYDEFENLKILVPQIKDTISPNIASFEINLIDKKYRLIKGMDGKNFKSHCTVTDDGRWFDNGGFPINPPSKDNIEDEEPKEEIGFVRRELTDEEKAEQAKWKAEEEKKMLEKLK